jgi:hypothetical protein
MTTLRLIHEDSFIDCDIVTSEAIKINKNFDNITTLKNSSNYTQTFTLPYTDALATFFGVIYNVTSVGWFDHRKKVSAEIIKDSIPVMRGYIQVKKHTILRDLVDIEVLFIGEIPDLQRNIGEKKLKDISTLSSLNYSLAASNWSDPNANTILSLCDKYGFGVTHDQSAYALQDVNYPTYIGLMTPAVKAVWLLDQIVKDAGFSYDNSYMASALNNVYVPFVSAKDLATDQGYENVFFNLGLSANLTGVNSDNNLTGLTEFADNGTNVAATVFTAPFYGTYTVRYWAKVGRTAGSGASSIRFVLFDPDASQQYAFSTNNMVFNTNGQTIYFSETRQITLNAGQRVFLQLQEISGAGTYTLYGDSENDQQSGTGWQLDAVSNPLLGASVNVLMDKNAPDMRQIDFLNSIVTAFKCAIVPDDIEPNRIVIRPMVDYIGTGDTVNFTEKLDTSKPIEVVPNTDIQKRQFAITYKADGDAANKIYTEGNKRTFGEYKITGDLLGDDVNDFATDEETIQLAFSATPCNYINSSSIITASFLSDSKEFALPTCRLLYKAGTATVNTVDDSFTPVTKTVYTMSNYSEPIPDFDSLDLNFGIETPLHSVLAQPYQTLWFRYWSRYYRELFSKESRTIEAYFNLDIFDVTNLSFNDKIYIENDMLGAAYWRLISVVDFDPEGDFTTKLKLARIVDLGLDCEFIPYSRATATGQILFSDGVTGGLNGSQKCCEKYGHVWNADEGKCFRRQSASNKISSLASNLETVDEQRAQVVYVNSDYVASPYDAVINVDSTSGAVNVYLPSARGSRNRQIVVTHHEGSGSVKVYPFGSEKVQDKTDVSVGAKGQSLTLTKAETGWTGQ